jgi:hypothetical protein
MFNLIMLLENNGIKVLRRQRRLNLGDAVGREKDVRAGFG